MSPHPLFTNPHGRHPTQHCLRCRSPCDAPPLHHSQRRIFDEERMKLLPQFSMRGLKKHLAQAIGFNLNAGGAGSNFTQSTKGALRLNP